MGCRPRAAAVFGVMRHEVLTHGGGDVRQPRRRGRWRALDGCQARPAGDSAGAAEEGRAALRRGTAWPDASRKGAVCGLRVAQNAPFRDVAARGARSATPRRPAGHYEKWPNWANALEQPPARLRGGVRQGSQVSAWGPAARKDAVGVYTNRRKRPLDVGLGHLCTLLRASCIG